MIEAFLFDLDGTLVTLEFDVKTLRTEIGGIFDRYGIPDYVFTKPLLESLAEVEITLSQRGKDTSSCRQEVMEIIKRREEEGAKKTSLIPGVEEFLSYLKKKGYKIAVVTRTNRESAMISLRRCRLESYIDILLSRSDVENLKPHPSHVLEAIRLLGEKPENCVMVGDHAMDTEVGKRAGCMTIGVLSGSGTKESLREADFVVENVSKIKDALKI